MQYTKEELLATMLYAFSSVDDIDIAIISNILSRAGFCIENPETDITNKTLEICKHIVISESNESFGFKNHLYSLPKNTSKTINERQFGFFFLSEFIDIEMFNFMQEIKKDPMEWFLRRVEINSNYSSLTNSTLKQEIPNARQSKYVKIAKYKLSLKGEEKIKEEEKNEIKRFLEEIDFSDSKTPYDSQMLFLLEHNYVVGCAYAITEKGKEYLKSKATGGYDSKNHGSKNINNPYVSYE